MNLEDAKLDFSYDEEDDVLYMSVDGRGDGPALTCETNEGHLVRLDPDTFELIGAEIFSFRDRWEGRDLTLSWDPPQQRDDAAVRVISKLFRGRNPWERPLAEHCEALVPRDRTLIRS